MKYILLSFVGIFVSISTFSQVSFYDSIVTSQLPYDSIKMSIIFKGKVRIDEKNTQLALKLDKWIQSQKEKGTIQDDELLGNFDRRLLCSSDILISKKDVPIKMTYTIELRFVKDGLHFSVSNIFYQNYSTGKEHEKMWSTAAEEAIVDESIYNQKGKLDKLRAEYKYETIVFINELSEDLKLVILSN